MVTQGRPRWYKPDRGLAARMVLTMFLLGLVYVAFAVALSFAHVPWYLLVFGAAAIAGVQFFFADKIALASMGARDLEPQQAPELFDMIQRLAISANLPMPRVAIVDTSIPNAFATGRDKNHAVVAVTTGILSQLQPEELEAVLAHELTHIINRDMLVMTIATFFSLVASLIVNNLFWIGMFGGGGYGRRRGNDDSGSYAFIIIVLASVVTYVLSFLLIRALSRYRELAADRGAALITGNPGNLASALMRISGNIQSGAQTGRIPDRDFRTAQGANALFIVPALKGDSLASLFSTHPSLEERVERLRDMQRQMESARNV